MLALATDDANLSDQYVANVLGLNTFNFLVDYPVFYPLTLTFFVISKFMYHIFVDIFYLIFYFFIEFY